MPPAKKSVSESTVAKRSAIPVQHLAEDEQLKLFAQWNATQAAYPHDRCIPRLFEAQVESTSDGVALVFEGQELTYRELNAQANQLALHLRRCGVGPEGRVGLCVERSLAMVVGLLGILKAGGAYVPLDPAYPRERLAFMIDDAKVQVLVTQQRLLEILPAHELVVCLDTDWPLIAQESNENSLVTTTSESLLYIMYTSGSTGQPKGVMGTHRSAINRFHWMWTTYPFGVEEVCCQKTPLSFVDSVWEIFGPLLKGMRTIIIPDNIVKDPKLLLHELAMHAVTRLVLVPSLLRTLLETAENFKDLLPDLKYCVSSGEVLPLDLARRFLNAMPQCVLLNLYGSSEVAADVTYYDMRQYHETLSCVPIGRPIANTQIYLLDEQMQPVRIGETGELYVGGDGLARGYFDCPELTAAKFVSHPFAAAANAKLYKTGDLARYLPDGNVEYLGRVDHQVKIRGVRIELGEIEVALRRHPAVYDAVVVAHEESSGDKLLVAYLVPSQSQGQAPTTPTIDVLQEHLRENLPLSMVPSAFVWLEVLPLTPNGKVDRRALPRPDLASRTSGEAFVAPTSMTHHLLCQTWQDLLNVRPIGIKDNFFYVGGHSLLAARLLDRIEQVFGKRLSLETLFAGPTIEQLALALETEEERRMRAPIVAVQATGSKRPFFYLHGAWDSDAFYCFQLARLLTEDQPFYALAPYHFGSGDTILTVEEMATIHLQSIRTIQPEGPYLLGGFCNGGLLAYEVARQLHAQGEQVECLVLIEPAHPPLLHMLARHMVNLVGRLCGFTEEKRVEHFLRLRHLFKYLMRQRRNVTDLKGFSVVDLSILTLTPTAHALLQDQYGLFDWMIAGYNYKPYAGKTMMIWAQKEPFRGVWRQKALQGKAVETQFVPGTHISCRTEYIQDLAKALGRSLNQSQTTELKGRTSNESMAVSVD